MPEAPSQPSVSSPPKPLSQQDYNFSLNRDLRALNASVLVITQKIKYLVRNEKILGRNLIVINKRVRDLQTQAGSTEAQGISEAARTAIEDLTKQVNAISQRLVEMETKLEDVSARAAREDEVKELKYVIENINPLHLITQEQAQKMMDEKLKK